MKKILLSTLIVFLGLFASVAQESFYDFVVKDIDGNEYELSQLKGKKVLVVNVASKCGFTPQYEELQELYEQFGGEVFVIIAFPANDFMSQEPGSNAEIKAFCTENYEVTFPMMSKISVKGKEQASLYAWLTQKEQNGQMDAKVKWNFQKFAIDGSGNLVQVYAPSISPMSDEIVAWIKE